MSVEEVEYDDHYFNKKSGRKDRAGKLVADIISDYFEFDSLVDLGCGDGRLTKPYLDDGVDVTGIDVADAAMRNNALPEERLRQEDLREEIEIEERDLVFCIEVAEHLKEEHADTLVENISKAGDQVVMTAAPPGQPGKGHVNCQPYSYWIEKLEDKGFEYRDDYVQSIQQDMADTELVKITPWIVRNIMVFKREKGGGG